MRTGRKTLKTRTGKTLHFKSAEKLEAFERFNKARKHGFKPKKRGKKRK